ncbi:MAG: T9SS type A sorting domain-containing protein, partial [Bacteroidota bacterium]
PGLSDGISTDIHLYANDSRLFFSANDGVHGVELWASDGTTINTKLIKDLTPGNESTEFSILTFLNANLLIAVTVPNSGIDLWTNQLWSTDGTAAGTKLIKGFGKALQSGFRENFHFKNKVYFVPPTAANGYELWVTDGTTSGTTLVKDIFPGTEGSSISLADAVSYSDKFIFEAYAEGGRELWSSDGTASGTQLFADINKGIGSSNPVILTNDATIGTDRSLYNGRVLFTADDGIHGDELWATDGTAANTSLVKDIYAGPIRSTNGWTYSCFFTSQKMYFTPVDEEHGYELWETDGKTAVMTADVAPGYVGSFPIIVALFKNHLYFVADESLSPGNLYILDELTTALPVNLVNFTAAAIKEDIQVSWTTATELNTSHFTIQRSADGKQFENIGTVNAAGSSTTAKQYSFLDANAMHTSASVLYYRLQMNDKDGKQYYSPTVPVKITGSTPGIAVYPNPATDIVVLNFNTQAGEKGTLRVLDASGKIILTKALSNLASGNQTSFSVKALPAGVYYVQIATPKGTQSVKFV